MAKGKRKSKIPPCNLHDVENPWYGMGKDETSLEPTIKVRINLTGDYVINLYRSKTISIAEYKAALRIRDAFDKMGGKGAGAIDYAKTRVDGGLGAQDITDAGLKASETFKDARRMLGEEGHELVFKMAGQGLFPKDISTRPSRQRYLAERFKDDLETMAVYWGYQQRALRAA